MSISSIINYAGASVSVKHITAGSYDTNTLTRTNTYSTTAVKAGVREYNSAELSGLIRDGDKEVRIAAADLTFTPSKADKITIDSIDYMIVSVDTRGFRDVAALHIIQVRGINP